LSPSPSIVRAEFPNQVRQSPLRSGDCSISASRLVSRSRTRAQYLVVARRLRLLAAQVCPEVPDERRDPGPVGAGAKVHDARIEDSGKAAPVDGHLGGLTGPKLAPDRCDYTRA